MYIYLFFLLYPLVPDSNSILSHYSSHCKKLRVGDWRPALLRLAEFESHLPNAVTPSSKPRSWSTLTHGRVILASEPRRTFGIHIGVILRILEAFRTSKSIYRMSWSFHQVLPSAKLQKTFCPFGPFGGFSSCQQVSTSSPHHKSWDCEDLRQPTFDLWLSNQSKAQIE